MPPWRLAAEVSAGDAAFDTTHTRAGVIHKYILTWPPRANQHTVWYIYSRHWVYRGALSVRNNKTQRTVTQIGGGGVCYCAGACVWNSNLNWALFEFFHCLCFPITQSFLWLCMFSVRPYTTPHISFFSLFAGFSTRSQKCLYLFLPRNSNTATTTDFYSKEKYKCWKPAAKKQQYVTNVL